jgi:hypothetical protein
MSTVYKKENIHQMMDYAHNRHKFDAQSEYGSQENDV